MDYDVPDSTDWLNTPLQPFASLENALHCQICKEFYDTPMLTSCSHTFCSKCIRTCLSADGRCPACRATDQASKLRNNWALQEVVAAFQAARPAALNVAWKEREEAERVKRPGKRKRVVAEEGEEGDMVQDGRRTTRSRSKRIAASQTSQPEAIEVQDSDEDADFEPEEDAEQERDDGLVACPLGCGKRMKIEAVEPHLDRCEDERKQQSGRPISRTPISSNTTSFGANPNAANPNATNPPRERFAELSYSLMNDTKLRSKLKEIGIPNWGSRQVMIKRHVEWANIWNANCDSSFPRSKRALLHDLDTWERTQGGRATNPNGAASAVMRKDFDGEAWKNRNRDDFTKLIANARRTKANSATPAKESKSPDEEQPSRDSTAVDPPSSSVADQPTGSTPSVAPYANNEVALSSIREKVAAANAGKAIEPVGNADFDAAPEGVVRAHDHRSPSRQSVGEQVPHALHRGESCELPEHMTLANSPGTTTTRMPMFAMPQRAVSDIDGVGGGAAAGGGA